MRTSSQVQDIEDSTGSLGKKTDYYRMGTAHLLLPISIQMESHIPKKAPDENRLSGTWVQALKDSAQPNQGEPRYAYHRRWQS